MKEATGELSMTVLTVVAIAAVAGLLYAFVWPLIKGRLVQQTCDTMGAHYTASRVAKGSCTGGCFAAEEDEAEDNPDAKIWCCCPETATEE